MATIEIGSKIKDTVKRITCRSVPEEISKAGDNGILKIHLIKKYVPPKDRKIVITISSRNDKTQDELYINFEEAELIHEWIEQFKQYEAEKSKTE